MLNGLTFTFIHLTDTFIQSASQMRHYATRVIHPGAQKHDYQYILVQFAAYSGQDLPT